jgi:HPt (histidine-containing phosphotransfer) domain-containing protein
MVSVIQPVTDTVLAPPLVPVARSIDVDHLARMTMGDRALEQDVLRLFVQQAEMLRSRMDLANPEMTGASAHTIKGSASGVGAFAVAQAAEKVEHIARGGDHEGLEPALVVLDAAIREAVMEISEILRA